MLLAKRKIQCIKCTNGAKVHTININFTQEAAELGDAKRQHIAVVLHAANSSVESLRNLEKEKSKKVYARLVITIFISE